MIECYAFAIGGMPDPIMHPIRAKRTAAWLMDVAEGLIGLHPCDRYHTLLVFKTLNDAKVSRNRIVAAGNEAGTHIMRSTFDDETGTLNVIESAD